MNTGTRTYTYVFHHPNERLFANAVIS